MNNRTRISFRHSADIRPIIEKWAGETGFKLKQSAGSEYLYQKGIGFLVAPMMLKVAHGNGETTLEAWVRVNAFMRLMALFLVPSEMGVESGGFRLVAPRSIARNAINKLQVYLGQPPIP